MWTSFYINVYVEGWGECIFSDDGFAYISEKIAKFAVWIAGGASEMQWCRPLTTFAEAKHTLLTDR